MRTISNFNTVKYLILIALAGFMLLLLVTIAYFLQFGGSPISTDPEAWSFFGSYLSGALGAPLSFLALIAILLTLQVQHQMLKQSDETFANQQIYLEQKEKKEEWLGIIRLAEDQIDKQLKLPVIKKEATLCNLGFAIDELYKVVIGAGHPRDKEYLGKVIKEQYTGMDIGTLYRFASLLGAFFGYLLRYRSLLIEADKDQIMGHYVSSYIFWYQRLEWLGVMRPSDCDDFMKLCEGGTLSATDCGSEGGMH